MCSISLHAFSSCADRENSGCTLFDFGDKALNRNEREVPFQATRLETKEEAQNAPTPVTTYALFYNGEYVTNEQMNDKRFIKLLDGMKNK